MISKKLVQRASHALDIFILPSKNFHTFGFRGELAIFNFATWVSIHCNIHKNGEK